MYKVCRFFFCCLFVFLSASLTYSQQISVEGIVRDSITSTPISDAFVFSSDKESSYVTNKDGSFKITVNLSEKIYVTHVSYQSKELAVKSVNTKKIIISLSPNSYETEEVKITSAQKKIRPEIGLTHINKKEIQLLPSLTGSEDILGAALLTPGIQSVNEGIPGIYVRGSAPGQNLTLLDNVAIYNPSHLLGFFPTINSYIVNSVEIYKGPAPADFGGRTSSFIDIESAPGTDSLSGEIQGGLLLSSLNLSAPIFNNNIKFTVAGRASYFTPIKDNLLLKVVNNTEAIFNNTAYDFNDLYVKIEGNLFKKHHISIFRFGSIDHYNMKNPDNNLNVKLNWGNQALGAKITSALKSNLYWDNTFGYSSYFFNMKSRFINYNHSIKTTIENPSFKSKISWNVNKHFIKAGIELNYYLSKPNNLTINIDSTNYISDAKYYGSDASVYINDTWNIFPKLKANYGLRYTTFQQLGPYSYAEPNPVNTEIDTTTYDKNEIVKTYHTLDPRITLSYQIKENQSIKTGFSINSQNIHLITVGSVSLPMDMIISGTRFISPEQSYQFNGSYEYLLKKYNVLMSVEGYYKRMLNQIELIGSLSINYNDNILPSLLSYGSGEAYGIEFLVKKQSGKLQGWIGYTLSRSFRYFEELNDGAPFPFKYDRVHDLSATATYNITNNLTLSSVFIYATGNVLTIPIARTVFQERLLNEYSDVNAFRVEPYHRMDLSVTYNFENKLFNYFKTHLSLSAYNVYNRHNVYYMLITPEGDPRYHSFKIKIEKISLYPILPSIAVKLEF